MTDEDEKLILKEVIAIHDDMAGVLESVSTLGVAVSRTEAGSRAVADGSGAYESNRRAPAWGARRPRPAGVTQLRARDTGYNGIGLRGRRRATELLHAWVTDTYKRTLLAMTNMWTGQ
jgi:hypothetical protein